MFTEAKDTIGIEQQSAQQEQSLVAKSQSETRSWVHQTGSFVSPP
jgi:hypothetical protein